MRSQNVLQTTLPPQERIVMTTLKQTHQVDDEPICREQRLIFVNVVTLMAVVVEPLVVCWPADSAYSAVDKAKTGFEGGALIQDCLAECSEDLLGKPLVVP